MLPGIALSAEHLSGFVCGRTTSPCCQSRNLGGNAGEQGIVVQFGGGEHLQRSPPVLATASPWRNRLESDRGSRARDHALAALDAARLAHGVVQVKADRRRRRPCRCGR